MDIEFHYYMTYLIAARAGFAPADGIVSLAEADFYEASLPGSRFQSCDLTATQLSKADLTGTRLHGSTLERIHGADGLRGVIIGSDQVVPAALAVFGTLNIVVDDELDSGD